MHKRHGICTVLRLPKYPLLQEILVTESNDVIIIVAGISEIAVSAHAQ